MNIYDQLQAVEDRYEELGENYWGDPDVISDTKRFMELSKKSFHSGHCNSLPRQTSPSKTLSMLRKWLKEAGGVRTWKKWPSKS